MTASISLAKSAASASVGGVPLGMSGASILAAAAKYDTPIGYNGVAMHAPTSTSLDRLALSATLHCLTGCAIGEVLGMVIGTALGLSNVATIVLAVALAYLFGFGLTSLPLLRSGLSPRQVAPLALASDTASITIMEIVDNAIVLLIPGAMARRSGSRRFWLSLASPWRWPASPRTP